MWRWRCNFCYVIKSYSNHKVLSISINYMRKPPYITQRKLWTWKRTPSVSQWEILCTVHSYKVLTNELWWSEGNQLRSLFNSIWSVRRGWRLLDSTSEGEKAVWWVIEQAWSWNLYSTYYSLAFRLCIMLLHWVKLEAPHNVRLNAFFFLKCFPVNLFAKNIVNLFRKLWWCVLRQKLFHRIGIGIN